MLKRYSSRAHLMITSSRSVAGLLAQFVMSVVALLVRTTLKNIRATVTLLKNVVKSVVSLQSVV